MTLEDFLQPDFTPLPDHSWYVMRVPYGRESAVANELVTDSCIPYVPKLKIANLLFLYTTEEHVRSFKEEVVHFSDTEHPRWKPSHIHPMYDHTRHNRYGGEILMTVPTDEMRSFILITNVEDEHVEIVPEEVAAPLQKNQLVEVTEGRFKGVKGRLARLKRQTCVIVMLDGVCTVSSAYIPRSFLQPIDN